MNVRTNLKPIALPVPEIIGYPKNWTVPGYAHAPSSPKFLRSYSSDASYEYLPNLKSVALPVPEIRVG